MNCIIPFVTKLYRPSDGIGSLNLVDMNSNDIFHSTNSNDFLYDRLRRKYKFFVAVFGEKLGDVLICQQQENMSVGCCRHMLVVKS
jgi:hypothetical protein